MSTTRFLFEVVLSLLWPPKGIIYFEEQVLQWIYAFGKVWLLNNAPTIIVIVTIYLLIMYVVFERRHHHRRHRGMLGRVIGFVGRFLTALFFTWGFLIYGALRGNLVEEENPDRGEANARYNITRTVYRGRVWSIVQPFTRISLHFRLGRWLYRGSYRLLGHIAYMRMNDQVRRTTARVLAMVVILWGVWNIPYDLTH